MERRRFIVQGMAGVSTLAIAGCSESSSSEEDNGSSNTKENNDNESDDSGGSTGSSDESGAEYRMYRYNSQNNSYISDQGPTSFSENWSGKGGYGRKPPAVVDGTVFMMTGGVGGKLFALDAESGEKQWEFPTGGNGTPAVDEDTVYIPDINKIHALNKSDGSRQWTFEPDDGGGDTAFPVLLDGTLYYSGSTKLFAIDTENGKEQWTYSPGGFPDFTAPAVSDGTVYVADEPKLYAINSSNGQQEWQSEIGYNLSVPVVADDSIYLGGQKVYAVTTDGGEEEWNFEMSKKANTPVVDDNSVYTMSGDDFRPGKVLSLSKNDGSEQWRASAEGTSLVVADNMVYNTGESSKRIVALDASNGDEQASWSNKNTQLGSLAVVNGTVYVGYHPAVTDNQGVISLS